MRVGIVGAGPAGAHLAHLLGSRGFEVLLFDAREAWEKPCGGGVTSKALREYTFLQHNKSPKEMVSRLRLVSGQGRQLMLEPKEEFAIYSRAELGRLMRDRATSSGAELHCTRVEKTEFDGSLWHIRTVQKEFTVDFLVGADGASSVVRRRVGVHFGLEDLTYALGWLVRSGRARPRGQAVVKYLSDLTGYIWIFPRPDHLSYGIASKFRETTPADLKARLLDFMEGEDPEIAKEIRAADHHSTPLATFYGAMIPALEPATWDRLSVASDHDKWALIGDAAGFVDPLTGEGIYYAIKSAELLADALPSRVSEYDSMWRSAFGLELRRAAELQQRFYRGEFAGEPLIERMLQFGRWHRGVRRTLAELITGDQGYLDLKETLKKRSFAII